MDFLSPESTLGDVALTISPTALKRAAGAGRGGVCGGVVRLSGGGSSRLSVMLLLFMLGMA